MDAASASAPEQLDQSDLDSLPLERLEQEITTLAAHMHAARCRWLQLVAEFDRREAWGSWGCRSTAEWLSWRCALAPGSAREHVRVARSLGELPQITESFARGELSFSKVRAVTRVATPEIEPELLELSRHATASQIERLVRGTRGAIAAELAQANQAYSERYVSCSWDDDGSLFVRARLAPEQGATFLRSLEAARDTLRGAEGEGEPSSEGSEQGAEAGAGRVSAETSEGGVSAETPTGAELAARVPLIPPTRPQNADALALVAGSFLSRTGAANADAERYEVVVHVDADVLAKDSPEGRSELDNGPKLAPETARRLACDASLVRILEREGKPLSVGRRTRTISPALRRALQSRDGCCQFPGCTQRRFLDAHHMLHWALGGATDIDNLILTCRHHHRLLHEGGFTVERREGGLVFRRPDGQEVPSCPAVPRGENTELVRQNHRRGLAIDRDTCRSLSEGDRLDYDIAVEGLLLRRERRRRQASDVP